MFDDKRDSKNEIQFYLDTETEDNIARGMSPEDARAAARRKLGNTTQIQEEIFTMNRGAAFLEALWQDMNYALRTMRKNPGFVTTAVLTLAIGIGANTAIFTVIRSILLKPLEYRDPDRLAYFSIDIASRNTHDLSFGIDQYRHLKASVQSMESMGVYGRPENLTVSSHGDPEALKAARVSGNFLEVLGISPAKGRSFLPEEDVAGGPPVAMISHGLWMRRFGGDPAISGKPVTIGAIPHVVVGVLPPGFEFPYPGVDIWVPRPNEWSLLPARYWGLALLNGFGRLKPGLTLQQAETELVTLTKQYTAAHPNPNNSDPSYTMRTIPLKERLVSNVRLMLWLVFGAAGFVLLIACGNLAGLLLARSASRAREFAVRAALGAGRGRLVRQILAESMVVAVTGGIAGVLLARWILTAITSAGALGFSGSVNALYIPGSRSFELDSVALTFTVVTSMLAALLFGLLPAFQSSRPDLARTLRGSGAAAGRASAGIQRLLFGWNLRDLLVTGQVALSIVLLIGAGLLLQSFARVRGVDPGFSTGRLLTAKVALPLATYDTPPERRTFFRDALAKVEAIPGVQAAAVAMYVPTTVWVRTNVTEVQGRPPLDGADPANYAVVQSVSPSYFQTLGLTLKMGRLFTDRDNDEKAPPVVIVNETFARKLWPDYPKVSPIGTHIKEGYDKDLGWIEVVGVVADIHQGGLVSAPASEFYLPVALHPLQTGYLIARSSSRDPRVLASAIREQVRAVDPAQSVSDIKTMDEVYEATLGQRRLTLVLLGSFAGVALLLALIGIYGLIAYSVTQRTQEVGIRRALGAQPGDILRLVLRHGLLLALVGGVLGVAGALALTRLIQGMLFGITPTDPATFGIVLALFVAVALAACYVPAQRASRIDPMTALRTD
jgi:putative ABC transport system permease protein